VVEQRPICRCRCAILGPAPCREGGDGNHEPESAPDTSLRSESTQESERAAHQKGMTEYEPPKPARVTSQGTA
jgi:hypothetical protein